MSQIVQKPTPRDWEILIQRIRDGRCTPFLGAGVYSEGPSLRSAIARKWAHKYGYPLADGSDLARVARFLSVEYEDAMYAPTKLIEELKNVAPPAFDDPDEPYTILAKLPLPLYITTNYDDFMEQALTKQLRNVQRDLCRWKKSIFDEPSPLAEGFQPDKTKPTVFHLYGYTENLQSLVLTEDDYFQFLVNVSKDQAAIPPQVEKVIGGNSLLLLGYRLDDWDFRVLFHLLASYLERTKRIHVAVQISPVGNEAPEEQRQKVQNFFDKYFESRTPDIRVTWETTRDFILKLKREWEKSGNGK